MEDRPTTIRVYPGELRPVYYTSVLASPTTTTLEVYIVFVASSASHEKKTVANTNVHVHTLRDKQNESKKTSIYNNFCGRYTMSRTLPLLVPVFPGIRR